MNNDRELLELAAKAAGIEYHSSLGGWKHEDWCRYWSDGEFCTCGGVWNPLTDDGDRYRLLSKLKMHVDFDSQMVMLGAVCIRWPEDEPNEPRAIVRAAAEIGKAKP